MLGPFPRETNGEFNIDPHCAHGLQDLSPIKAFLS